MKIKLLIFIVLVILINILAKACKDDKTNYIKPEVKKDSVSNLKTISADTTAVETARVVADSLPPVKPKNNNKKR